MKVSATSPEFASLLGLKPGWDSYKARAINLACVNAAVDLLGKLPPHLKKPHVVPLVTGGVQLEWHTRSYELEIAFEDKVYFWFCKAKRETEGYLPEDLNLLLGCLDQKSDVV